MSGKLTGVLAATAFVALAGAIPAAEAQMMPAPQPRVMAPMPMQTAPDRAEIYSDTPKFEPGDANWSAKQNVADSDRYERLVHTNPAFRAARIRKECGMFQDPAAFQQCAATFNQ